MKIINVFKSVFVVAVALALLFCGGPARADTLFQLDNGVVTTWARTRNWTNSEMMWLNHYTTPGGQPYWIDELGVAFANEVYNNTSPATIESQTVYVDLYSDPSGGGHPYDAGVQLLAEGSFDYNAGSPPSSTTLTWTSITPTQVTGSFFGQGLQPRARADNAIGSHDNDGPTLTYVADHGNAWVAFENNPGTPSSGLINRKRAG